MMLLAHLFVLFLVGALPCAPFFLVLAGYGTDPANQSIARASI